MRTAKLLNSSASVNQFRYIDTVDFVIGTKLTINFRMFDSQLKERHVPASGAIVTLTFNKADGTTFDATSTVLDSGDRSMRTVVLTTSQTADLLGGNVILTYDILGDGTEIEKSLIQGALSRISLDSI
jgi:hypothetical protein